MTVSLGSPGCPPSYAILLPQSQLNEGVNTLYLCCVQTFFLSLLPAEHTASPLPGSCLAAAGKLWEEVQALHKHCTTTQKGCKDRVLPFHPTDRPLPFQPIQFFIQGLVWHRLALFLKQSCLILLNAQITGAPTTPRF